MNKLVDWQSVAAQPDTPAYSATKTGALVAFLAWDEARYISGRPLVWIGALIVRESLSVRSRLATAAGRS